jgi:hypothetical protein
MGKAAFVLGIVGSLIAGVLLSSRLDHRDYSGSIVNKLGGHTTCPTFWMSLGQDARPHARGVRAVRLRRAGGGRDERPAHPSAQGSP